MSFTADQTTPRGRFITLEGGEGVGKSTQAQRLVDRLARHRIPAIATREPGGTPSAETFRNALLSGAVAPFGPAAEALVFSAARIDHLDARIAPALGRGVTVVCDRFVDSTRAYQGALGSLDPALIHALERIVVGDLMPDLTLILDVPSTVGVARAAARRGVGQGADRFEQQGADFHEGLRQAFLAIAAQEPGRCVVVDGEQPLDRVADAIWAAVTGRIFPSLHERAGAAGQAP